MRVYVCMCVYVVYVGVGVCVRERERERERERARMHRYAPKSYIVAFPPYSREQLCSPGIDPLAAVADVCRARTDDK